MAAAAIAVGAGLVFLLKSPSAENASASASASDLKFSETNWDLGDVSMKNGVNRKEVDVTNAGDRTAPVIDLETSCMCTSATIVHADGRKSPTKGMPGHGDGGMAGHSAGSDVSEEIAPGETVKLLIDFDPNAHGPGGTGPAKRTVTVKTGDGKSATLKFSAVVVR